MSPKFHADSLNSHLPSRIGSALILLAMLLYVGAMVVPVMLSTESLTVDHWHHTLGSLLLLGICGVPAGQYAWTGSLD